MPDAQIPPSDLRTTTVPERGGAGELPAAAPDREAAEESVLTLAEARELQALMRDYPGPRAACIEALNIMQRRHRWISDARLEAIAALLGMSPAELDGVATFYNLVFRRPVGRHVVLLCNSVSCWIMGRERLLHHLRQRLGIDPGETTPDERFTLLPTVCLGHCDRAPAMMIDGDLHGDLDTARIDTLLDSYR